MENQKFISNFEHHVVFGKNDTSSINLPNITLKQLQNLVQHTSSDAELGARIRQLINNTYGK